MKPLRELDDEPNRTTEYAVWFLVFLMLGVLILANRTPESSAWAILSASVSFAAAAGFLYRLLIKAPR